MFERSFFGEAWSPLPCKLDLVSPNEMKTLVFWAAAAAFCLGGTGIPFHWQKDFFFFLWELIPLWGFSGLICFFPFSCRIHWLLDLSLSTCHPEEDRTREGNINKQWPHPHIKKKKKTVRRTKHDFQNTCDLLSAHEKRFGITRWPQLLLMSHHPLFGVNLWIELLETRCYKDSLAILSGCAGPTVKALLCQSLFIQFARRKSCWRYCILFDSRNNVLCCHETCDGLKLTSNKLSGNAIHPF